MNALNLYAAGSLRYAFPALIELFKQQYSLEVTMLFSPAGLLCDKIQLETDKPVAHLFASANTIHPQTLVAKGLAKSHVIFAHNRLCMMVRNQPQWTTRSWLEILFDTTNRIGMSTPKKDPSGDYTFSLFDCIEAKYLGMGEQLKQRAMQLVGSELALSLPNGIRPSEYFLLNDVVDVFIGYANYVTDIRKTSQLAVIEIPTEFYQAINYSIALLNHPHHYAQYFIDFLLSDKGQSCLQKNGFIKH